MTGQSLPVLANQNVERRFLKKTNVDPVKDE